MVTVSGSRNRNRKRNKDRNKSKNKNGGMACLKREKKVFTDTALFIYCAACDYKNSDNRGDTQK